MKSFIIVFLILTSISCAKKSQGTMTVIKGCEGVYLRFNNLDYTVCNEEKLDSFNNGDKVEAKFTKEDNCKNGKVHCMSIHDHPTAEGNYCIVQIK